MRWAMVCRSRLEWVEVKHGLGEKLWPVSGSGGSRRSTHYASAMMRVGNRVAAASQQDRRRCADPEYPALEPR